MHQMKKVHFRYFILLISQITFHTKATLLDETTTIADKGLLNYRSAFQIQPQVDSNRCEDRSCCESTYTNFINKWREGQLHLTGLLEVLKAWNCTEFMDECQERTFAFNEYTSLVYDKFCDFASFTNHCKTTDNYIVDEETFITPCEQVDLHNSSSPYLEIISYFSPFCGIVWCGFDLNTIETHKISTWSCLSLRCRTNIIMIMVIIGILAVVTILANFTVIWVIGSNHKEKISIMLYKLSLAFGDLLVGLIVLPSFISTMYLRFIKQRDVEVVANTLGVSFNHYNQNTSYNLSDLVNNNVIYGNEFPHGYLSVIGFFTALSLMVSVYTLMMASYDRFKAVWKPLEYNHDDSIKLAKRSLLAVWIIAIIFALLPVFTPGLYPYQLIAGIVVGSRGSYAIIMYFIALLLPFIAVWVNTLGSWCIVKRQARKLQRLKYRRDETQTAKQQMNLTKTVSIMLFAFTLSLLPAIIGVVVSATELRIRYENPKNLVPSVLSAVLSFELVAGIILMCNSMSNCLIYSVRDPEFRKNAIIKYKALARQLGRLFCCERNAVKTNTGRRSISSKAFFSTEVQSRITRKSTVSLLVAETWLTKTSSN